MQIVEVKYNIAKIIYNPAENRLLPSDFLLIEDANQKIIAQVINIETTEKTDSNLAVLRLALNIDKEDNLSYFNGYIPAKNSKLIYITSDEIIELIKGNEDNIYFGNLSNHPSCFVKTNMSFIDDRLYVQSDRTDKTEIVFKNIISELKDRNKKIIILDFDGQYSSAANVLKLKVSKNIRLPLNMDAFDTILKYDIVDCPIEDKAVVQSIVLELREYLSTLKDKFIPFNMFKQVVDNEFATNPVSGLMLLRNKLWLYAQDSIFADKKEQFDVINSALFSHNIIIIDASDIAEKWHKFIIQTTIELTNHDSYLFLSLNDIELDKKTINGFYNKKNIIPVVSTTYDSPYRPLLKSLCKNQLLCKPSDVLLEREYYSELLEMMNNNDFLIFGETTLYLPLQVELQQFNSDTAEDVVQNDIKKDVDKLLSSPQTVIPSSVNVMSEVVQAEPVVEEKIVEEIIEEEPIEEKQNEEDAINQLDELVDDDITDSDFDFLDEIQSGETKQEVSQSQEINQNDDDDILNVPFNLTQREDEVEAIMNSLTYDVFEPVKEVQKVGVDEPIIVETEQIETVVETVPIEENEDEQPVVQEELAEADVVNSEEEIANQVDEEILEENIIEDNVSNEELSEIDAQELIETEEVNAVTEEESIEDEAEDIVALDSVIENIENKAQNEEENSADEPVKEKSDELVVEFEDDEEEENEVVQPPQINENINTKETPKVPIYETDTSEPVMIDQIPFKVNDRVFHPKYGNGVIESFIQYSNNILFSLIDFDTAGRKMLDPRISGIEKVR